jgi:hypothetical protein
MWHVCPGTPGARPGPVRQQRKRREELPESLRRHRPAPAMHAVSRPMPLQGVGAWSRWFRKGRWRSVTELVAVFTEVASSSTSRWRPRSVRRGEPAGWPTGVFRVRFAVVSRATRFALAWSSPQHAGTRREDETGGHLPCPVRVMDQVAAYTLDDRFDVRQINHLRTRTGKPDYSARPSTWKRCEQKQDRP